MKKWKLPPVGVPFAVLVAFLILSVDCESDSVGEWQILTKQNFSSDERLNRKWKPSSLVEQKINHW
jgi:hypothetical protein